MSNVKDTTEAANQQSNVSQGKPNKNNNRKRWNNKPKQDQSTEPPKPVGTAYSAGQPMQREELATSNKFKPQHLSKQDSASKEGEILTDKSILVEGISLTSRQVRKYGIDCSQFLEIVESAYKARQHSDKRFKDLIPLSVFVYYCEVLLWKRILFLLTGSPDVTESSYANFIASLPDMSVPQEIGQYIDGIGHIKDPAGVVYQLDIDTMLVPVAKGSIAGHYGKLSKDNHYMYETIPAPLIALERLAYDILQFRDPTRSVYWDSEKSPATTANKYLPNRNLLGWAPAAAVSQSQYAWISETVEVEVEEGRVSWTYHDMVNQCNNVINNSDAIWHIKSRDSEENKQITKNDK